MRARRASIALTALTAVAALLTGCGSDASSSAGADGTTRIRLATTSPTVTLLAIYAAEQQGFFKDHQLDVQITSVPDATTIPAAIGKQFDVGWTVQPIGINAAASGVPLTIVGGGERNQPDNQQLFLLSAKGSKYRTVADLASAKIGSATLAGANTMLVKATLDKAGVDPGSAQFVQVAFSDMPDQLAAGAVDVIAVSPPNSQVALDAGAQDLGVSPYNIISKTALTTFMMANTEWAKKNATALKGMREALDEGGEWINAHPAAAKNLLSERTGMDAATVEKLALQLPHYTYRDYAAGDFVPWVELMKTYGTLDKGVDANQLITKMLGK
ncbi:ABC transporter substrate-binding protein [Streptomyces shenzhenensis]|uniref:ABC transporter substrate-binding protein n=1 Tax=Streptomyces shenzhenensis TaxID=943815 RepID=UPI003696D2BD